jgi:alpha-galactosidase
MMEVGNGMSVNEDRAHFTMWCMLAAPLIAGNDLRTMSNETLAILTNKDVIAVNQDKLGVQGMKYSADDSLEIWFKPLAAGDWAVCFLNRDGVDKKLSFNWNEHPVSDSFSKRDIDCAKTTFTLRDLWTKKNVGTTAKMLSITVPAHDVTLLKLSPKK